MADDPRALCSLADIALRIPGYNVADDEDVDALLQSLLIQESRDFMEACGREITPHGEQPDVREFELTPADVWARELEVDDMDEVDDVTIVRADGTVVQELEPASWVELPRVREDWQPIEALRFPRAVDDSAQLAAGYVVEVAGTFGFPAIPDTVKQAVVTFVIVRYLNDVASAGTRIAELASKPEFNLSGALAVALGVRRRLRNPTLR